MLEINMNSLEMEKQEVISYYKKQVEAFRRIKKEAERVQWADANYDEFVTTMNIIGQALSSILGTISNGTDVYVISELLPLARAYLENERKFPRI